MNKNLFFISIFAAFMILISSCKKDDSEPDNPTNSKTTAVFNTSVTYGTLTDQDGNTYKTVTIGTQTWMAENLRTTKYNDGTPMPNLTNDIEWVKSTEGAYCNYNNTSNSDTIATFGRLYNWYAVKTGKLAPIGWHVPTNADWTILTDYLGGESVAGGKLKESGDSHWLSPNTGATNETGFTVVPGGARSDYDGSGGMGYQSVWWSATETGANAAWFLGVQYNSNSVNSINSMGLYLAAGFSVRCVKD